MSILKNWQTQLRAHFLQKMMLQLDRRRHPVPFNSAQSVGVLFDATEQVQRDQVMPFIESIKKQVKQVTAIGFLQNKQDASSFSFKGFNLNDIDWLGRPKKEVLENYAGEAFDFLICIYQKECLPIEYIAALSKAQMRVGPYTDNTYCYDLIIDTTKNDSTKHFLKEVEFYLHKINNTHAANSI